MDPRDAVSATKVDGDGDSDQGWEQLSDRADDADATIEVVDRDGDVRIVEGVEVLPDWLYLELPTRSERAASDHSVESQAPPSATTAPSLASSLVTTIENDDEFSLSKVRVLRRQRVMDLENGCGAQLTEAEEESKWEYLVDWGGGEGFRGAPSWELRRDLIDAGLFSLILAFDTAHHPITQPAARKHSTQPPTASSGSDRARGSGTGSRQPRTRVRMFPFVVVSKSHRRIQARLAQDVAFSTLLYRALDLPFGTLSEPLSPEFVNLLRVHVAKSLLPQPMACVAIAFAPLFPRWGRDIESSRPWKALFASPSTAVGLQVMVVKSTDAVEHLVGQLWGDAEHSTASAAPLQSVSSVAHSSRIIVLVARVTSSDVHHPHSAAVTASPTRNGARLLPMLAVRVSQVAYSPFAYLLDNTPPVAVFLDELHAAEDIPHQRWLRAVSTRGKVH